MLDIGWSELMVIGVVALIVVGPRDLPIMFRTIGRFTGKARSMARDFQRAMDEAAKSTGVDETIKDLRNVTSKKSLGIEALENAATKFEKWSPTLPSGRPAPKDGSAPKGGSATAPDTAAKPAGPAGTPDPAAAIEEHTAAEKAPLGAETKALAEKRAADRQALLESVGKMKEKARPGPSAKAATKPADDAAPAVKPVRRTKAKADAPVAAETAAPKPRARTRAKKSDA